MKAPKIKCGVNGCFLNKGGKCLRGKPGLCELFTKGKIDRQGV